MGSSLDKLKLVVKEFCEKRWDQKSPLLLGYSGGPDSKALLYALKDWGKSAIHLAHVDHGWRQESAEEARLLEKEAGALSIPFHSIRLERKTGEDEARRLRLVYFASLRKEIPYQALLLGHQADDLAETALKRVLEGAHLTRLFGMKEETILEGVPLWRPMLSVRRFEIEEALEELRIAALRDPSNLDLNYLRAKMRQQLLPQLETAFGKNVSVNLQLLAQRSRELDEYFSMRINPLHSRCKRGPFGLWVDGNGVERIELRYLLQNELIALSRDLLEQILDGIEQKKVGLELKAKGRSLIVDRGHLFFLDPDLPRFEGVIELSESGQSRSGAWSAQICEEAGGASGWPSLWEGSAAIAWPSKEPIRICLPPKGLSYRCKGPAFLRRLSPLAMCKNEVVGDFLTPQNIQKGRVVKIFIKSNSKNVN